MIKSCAGSDNHEGIFDRGTPLNPPKIRLSFVSVEAFFACGEL